VIDARAAAKLLGGEVSGRNSVSCPGPGNHSRRDRSLSVRFDPAAPEGFLVHSHAGDDPLECRDHVRGHLGLDPNGWRTQSRSRRPQEPRARPAPATTTRKEIKAATTAGSSTTAAALALWDASTDPRPTPVGLYLECRGLKLEDDVAGDVLRWSSIAECMIALFRSIETDEPRAISRTFLSPDGRKLGRKFLGPVGGCAIKLDADDAVLGGLHVSEGIETAQAARQLGLRPTWALGSAGAITSFPILSGVEALTLLAENDEASAHAAERCAARWHAAGREVLVNRSLVGKDLADFFKGSGS
jgi:putative DNA primase/helicase